MLKKRKAFQISNSLKEGLEDTIKAAENYSGQLRVEAIPLRKIELDPENPRELLLTFEDLPQGPFKNDPDYARKESEKQSLESIATSIRNEGVINPILVYKQGEKYRVVAGERRSLASKLAGKEDIPAKILNEKPSELKLSVLQWIENIEREDLTLWERLRNLEKIITSIQDEPVTATQLKNMIGCSLSQAVSYVAVIYAEPKIKQAIQENQLRNLEKAAFIAKINSNEARDSALMAGINGASMNEIKKIVTEEKQREEKKLQSTVPKRKGRQAQMIALGNTKKTAVVKLLVNSILNHMPSQHLHENFEKLNWHDYSSVSKAFNQLLRELEEKVT